jgi:transglutaminase-like putative cysteine protease
VAGYLPDSAADPVEVPMDFSSWFEVWLDGRWWTFDPRNNERRVGRVVIARGRDALDAAMVTTWGSSTLKMMTVWAEGATCAC